MNLAAAIFGSAPAPTTEANLKLAALRALRTFIQGVVAAFGAGGAGSAILATGYWETFGVSVLGAAITALASFLQNVAAFLPQDPTQRSPAADSPPVPSPAPNPPTA